MGNALRKFMSRAPRYVLRPQDTSAIRLSHLDMQGPGAQIKTSMLNLSESGMALLMDPSLAPVIGEKVKVEIPVPGGEKIAWFATCVRIEAYNNTTNWWFNREVSPHVERVVVGLRFDDLPAGHQKSIRKGLEKSFLAALREERHRRYVYWKHIFVLNIGKVLLFGFLAALTFGILYLISRPTGNYDPDRGAPWGDRRF